MDQTLSPNPLLANKKLGLLLSTDQDNPNAETVYQLSKTALSNNVDTYLYLIDEGVKNLQDPRFIQLAAEGLKLIRLRVWMPTASHLNRRLWQGSHLLWTGDSLQHH